MTQNSPADLNAAQRSVAPGSIVVVRDMEWLVTAVEPSAAGQLVHVQGLSELVRDTTASFYSGLDCIEPLEPADARVVADDSPGYRRAKLWLEATLRKTPVPLGSDALTVSTQMLTDSLGYQRAAVRQALSPEMLRPRILLADAVGLGKTIEIGMILSELVRRGRGDRILIVTPRHVLEQMQHEMWTRFALPFVRLDSVGIQRVRQQLPATRNPFSMFKRAIISIDTLKQEKYRSHLAKQRWDAVVIDESHNITGKTLNNRLANTLAPNTEALILASATPHNGKPESFAELIRLLEPTAVTPEGDIIEEEARRLIIRRHRHSPEVAREVGADWAERLEPQHLLVPASPAEDAVAEELAGVWLYPGETGSPYSGENSGLFPWTLAKAFLSSPVALLETVVERRKRLGENLSVEQRRERDALDRLEALAERALAEPSAKLAELLRYLKLIKIGRTSPERVVVFSERVATLKWLRERVQEALKLKDGQVAVLHGGLSDVEQQEIVESFKQQSSEIRVLITGDVASEGVNLHTQCHELIHFDIPWSLIRIEQRNGRIDRYGQRHRPQITTVLLEPSNAHFSGDLRVLKRLVEREQEAHTALGDAASLMGKYSADAEEDAIKRALARGTDVDDIVPTIEEAVAGQDSVAGLLARLAAGQRSGDSAPAPRIESGTGSETPVSSLAGGAADETGLFGARVDFLREALIEVYAEPGMRGQSDGGGGVNWSEQLAHGTVSLAPRPDLMRRLSVLPQSYLSERRVREKLQLATTERRARAVLHEAIHDPAEHSLWPEAHFLGPLHPVLDWAADRALGRLGRNEVFSVQAEVGAVTVLLVGTLTDGRGRTVAASYMTAEYPDPEAPAFGIIEVHENARDALAACGLAGPLVNRGSAAPGPLIQGLIAPAVRNASQQMGILARAAGDDVHARVSQWSARVDAWQDTAAELTQLQGLRSRRVTVAEEQELAESMRPRQTLVRPLLVVVPAGSAGEEI
ncbi:helicase-related protein [Leucobacter sp. M11]|uniref:helicase-related protein n=1 Tax=Leucobacter sp. M11 TaxID=2993565 RepID=UPI002D809A4B|nr:helicase-related protein [Leucobacter sp. M11]MEB4616440.1 helicase-related protein [Leucobacter sp. M11]